MCDLLIQNGIVITMDPQRRVLDNGAVAISGKKIAAVGPTDEILAAYQSERIIDASRKVVMPGLIDGHAHAGHALIKTIGTDVGDAWGEACHKVYQNGSDEEFWYADAQLSALERLKCGTTTSVNLLGGGDDIMRSDDHRYAQAHIKAVDNVGIREILAVGPEKPPFPKMFSHFAGETRRDEIVDFDLQMQVTESLILAHNSRPESKIRIGVNFPVVKQDMITTSAQRHEAKAMARAARNLSKAHGALFLQDGHRKGTIDIAARELDLLGPDAVFSHNIDLTAEEIELCRQTGTKIVHNPSAIMSMIGRCPVTELIEAGVTVFLGSDAAAPDRGYDMFRHMFQAMRYHRRHFQDPSILPAGKVLEMVTIDSARGLGMENEIGSLEPGKQADIILLDMQKPHLYPLNMPLYRIAYFANGSDVDTVIIAGEILMEKRQVKHLNELEILDQAQAAAEKAIQRSGLEGFLGVPERFWGYSKL